MPPEIADASFLWDMLQASQAVVEFARGRTFHDYLNDKLLRSAVERQIEVIGEAARRISAGCQSAHPEIPWRLIIAQRHVLAHEYGEIKHERLWRVVTEHIPTLILQLAPLIPLPPKD